MRKKYYSELEQDVVLKHKTTVSLLEIIGNEINSDTVDVLLFDSTKPELA